MVPPIIGESRVIRNLKTLISKVAPSGENILLCGETGVGKDHVAQSIYHQSTRVGKPFAKLNCDGLTESLFDIDISFIDQAKTINASEKKRQLFNKISGGILFLDNIDLLSPAQQSEILSFVQNDDHLVLDLKVPAPVDVCMISSTTQDLEKMVKEGKFSERLYFRLNTVRIDIAPLRERPEDIPFLISYFLENYASAKNGHNGMVLDKGTIDELCAYHWPGNVRELQNFLKRLALLEGTGKNVADLIGIQKNRHKIVEADISNVTMLQSNNFSDYSTLHASGLNKLPLKKASKIVVERAEKELISNVLEKTGWNRSKAVKILDISYKTLLQKIQKLNIQPS
jgi:DNA-binding NtrC family response regulator